MKKSLIFGVVGIMAAVVCQAEPLAQTTTSEAFAQCVERSGGVTVAMRDCSDIEYQRLDRLLNQSYRTALANMGQKHRRQLQDAQRKWLAYSQAHCDTVGMLSGGTMDLLNRDGCRMDQIIQRIDELRDIAQFCSEGSCQDN
ncbi:MAG: lysozyme inhibitor LprI family protein [Neisseria sp.]|nr:lysozyme inhibitor LprI family protein [Neisseria sp.]